MTAKLVKKISPATIAKEKLVRLDVDGASKEVVLYDVYGVIAKTKSGTTDKGEWISFVGDVEAVTPDGEIFRAPRVFLAQPMEDMLFSALMQAKEADEGATIQFAARVSIVKPTPGKPSMTGYEYRVTPLVQAEDSNPMKALRDQAKQAVLALSAPKVVPVSETKSVAETIKKA